MKSRLIFLSLIILFSGVSLVYGQKPLRKPVRSANSQKVQQPKQQSRSFKPLVLSVSGTVNGHDYVDLGLSVKWATCNVGANSPEEYGDYYAWGEINTKADYSSGSSTTYGKRIGDIAGLSAYDVARVRWAKGWHLPTKKEIEELKTKCTISWITYKGVKGCLVKRKGKCLFFPAAGYRRGESLLLAGEYGSYWSSTPYESIDYGAFGLSFDSSRFDSGWDYRSNGFSVRPVRD